MKIHFNVSTALRVGILNRQDFCGLPGIVVIIISSHPLAMINHTDMHYYGFTILSSGSTGTLVVSNEINPMINLVMIEGLEAVRVL